MNQNDLQAAVEPTHRTVVEIGVKRLAGVSRSGLALECMNS